MSNYIKQYFDKHWSRETSYDPNWNSLVPSRGQCAVSALLVQKLIGGDIAKLKLPSNESHYFNVIDGNIYDVTNDQFQEEINYEKNTIVKRIKLLSNEDTASRYELFTKSILPEIEAQLPTSQIEHLSIRDPNYVAGSAEKPEVKIFCQTNKKCRPLNESKLAPKQNIYMKWTGGPIVAKSQLVSWHVGKFENGVINQLRELTIGTNLFGLSEYWESVSEKERGFYAVTHLVKEEWLENILYPTTKSYGSSWVYLDTIKKKYNGCHLAMSQLKKE